MTIIRKIQLSEIEVVIVDGHVYVDNNKTYGLGGYTWEAIEYKVPVIGVAKRGFFANKQTVVEVIRG
ncbi:MAG: hypothetical protein HRT67_02425 [Flavobacteriaceae bacterium]|nr:hypothetical protein [Flavobacteriaceae bacterium]